LKKYTLKRKVIHIGESNRDAAIDLPAGDHPSSISGNDLEQGPEENDVTEELEVPWRK
jgi:hypothetical protein